MKRLLFILGALLFVSRAHAQTITAANNTATTATAVTVTITVPSGAAAVICADQNVNNSATLTITDSASQTGWTQEGGYGSGSTSQREGCFYRANNAALTTITATWSGPISGRIGGRALAITGMATTSILDAAATATATNVGTSLASGSLTTTNANDVLIDDVGTTAVNTIAPQVGSGFTTPTGGNSQRGGIMTKTVVATQTGLTTTPTWGTAATAAEQLFALKVAAAGGTTAVPHLMMVGVGD